MKRRIGGLLLLTMAAAGCGRAPEFNVLGSYFPGWIACAAIGVALTAVVRLLLRWLQVEHTLRALPLFYLAVAVIFSSVLWMLIFE